jgi:chromosome partitioning protein
MRKIALVNQKGGCGKTTTAINLARSLAGMGKTVLLIDLDPQGHVALGFGVKPDHIHTSVYEVLLGQVPVTHAIRTLRERLDAVLSDVILAAFELVMAGAQEREFKLTRALEEVPARYDYIIIDSPPSLGLLTFNALLAADEATIPVEPSFFSLQGLQRLLETIQVVESKANHPLTVKILATNFDRRTNFCREMFSLLQTRFPEHFLGTVIRNCTALREAARQGKPIGEYDQKCSAFADYQDLAREVLNGEAVWSTTPGKPTGLERLNLAELASETNTIAASGLDVRSGSKLPAEREVIFSFEAPPQAAVQLAGNFNNWVPEPLVFTDSHGRQVWHTTVALKPGAYEYKYVVDGRWLLDPHNSRAIHDPYGGLNSVLNVW